MYNDRWNLSWDMNSDGLISISDFWLIFEYFFFLPGDILLIFLIHLFSDSVLQFFEISTVTDVYGTAFSGIISFILWLTLLGANLNDNNRKEK